MSFAKVNTFCQSIGGRVAEVSSVDDYWSIKFHLGKPQLRLYELQKFRAFLAN